MDIQPIVICAKVCTQYYGMEGKNIKCLYIGKILVKDIVKCPIYQKQLKEIKDGRR